MYSLFYGISVAHIKCLTLSLSLNLITKPLLFFQDRCISYILCSLEWLCSWQTEHVLSNEQIITTKLFPTRFFTTPQ